MARFAITRASRVYFGSAALMLMVTLVIAFDKARHALSAPSTLQTVNSQAPNLPTLDYEDEKSKPKNKERKAKNSHFNGRGAPNGKTITELPDGIEPLPIASHWWVGLSALPINQSDVVVLGFVGGSEAHLSDDNTGIYSEYSFVVSEILKDSSHKIVAGPLVVNRLGGAVRFKSGRIQRYEISGQDVPKIGGQYVLFLRRTPDGDLLILTGYELSNGRVTPLDGEAAKDDPRKALPFAKYRNAEQSAFLNELREAAVASIRGRIIVLKRFVGT